MSWLFPSSARTPTHTLYFAVALAGRCPALATAAGLTAQNPLAAAASAACGVVAEARIVMGGPREARAFSVLA